MGRVVAFEEGDVGGVGAGEPRGVEAGKLG